MKCIEVVAAVILRGGRVLATQRGYGEQRGGWEFPGGKVEPGEEPRAALAREIQEELGARVAVGELLGTVEYDYPAFHLSMQCYACTLLQDTLELREHDGARWLAAAELESVDWLPADVDILPQVRRALAGHPAGD